jgi:hypothetical protein
MSNGQTAKNLKRLKMDLENRILRTLDLIEKADKIIDSLGANIRDLQTVNNNIKQ